MSEPEPSCRDPLPHPDADGMRQFGTDALAWVIDQFQHLSERPVGQTASPATMEALLSGPAPEEGQGFAATFREFRDKVAPYAVRIDHPRFLAFIPTAPTIYSILGELLCAGANFFGGVWLEAAGPSQVERVVIHWFQTWLGYPPEAGGLLTSGGSEANLTALVVARERLAALDRPRAVLYVADQRHWSVDRAAKIMGLLPEQIRPIETDAHYRLTAEPLLRHIQLDEKRGLVPWAVVANAGATNTGAIDALTELSAVCRDHGLWLHGDAAYGWPIKLSKKHGHQLAGIDLCDSITLDPHKWFGQTFDAGCLLVRQGDRLVKTFSHRPEYMRDVEPGGGEINYADLGLALTRRFRALKIWLSVKALGLGWFRSLIDHTCDLASYAEQRLRQLPGIEILSPAQLSIVCFRFFPPDATGARPETDDANRFNERLAEAVRNTGQAFVTTTRLRNLVALRFCFTNWRTTASDVDRVIGLLTESRSRE